MSRFGDDRDVDPLRPEVPVEVRGDGFGGTAYTTTLTCVHCRAGLCEACLREYLDDPQAFWDYGHHPEGLARWRRLEEELRRDAAPPPSVPGPEIPF